MYIILLRPEITFVHDRKCNKTDFTITFYQLHPRCMISTNHFHYITKDVIKICKLFNRSRDNYRANAKVSNLLLRRSYKRFVFVTNESISKHEQILEIKFVICWMEGKRSCTRVGSPRKKEKEKRDPLRVSLQREPAGFLSGTSLVPVIQEFCYSWERGRLQAPDSP